MQRPRAAVLVDLSHGDVGDHAGDRDVDARVLQRQLIDGGIAAFDEEVRRERLVIRRAIVLRAGIYRQQRRRGDDSKNDGASRDRHGYLFSARPLTASIAMVRLLLNSGTSGLASTASVSSDTASSGAGANQQEREVVHRPRVAVFAIEHLAVGDDGRVGVAEGAIGLGEQPVDFRRIRVELGGAGQALNRLVVALLLDEQPARVDEALLDVLRIDAERVLSNAFSAFEGRTLFQADRPSNVIAPPVTRLAIDVASKIATASL